MEQNDHQGSSPSEEVNPLTVRAPQHLLPSILLALGLEKPVANSPGEREQIDPLAALQSEKWSERVAALQALGARGGEMPTHVLVQALQDEHEYVRAAAARVAGRIQATELVQPLLDTLQDGSWTVRAATAQALGRIGSRDAVEPLLALLRADEHEAVRASSVEALGRMGEDRPLQALVLALQDSAWLVREAAVSALGEAGREAPLESLTLALQDADMPVRQAAQLALQRIYPVARSVKAADSVSPQDQTASASAPISVQPAISQPAVSPPRSSRSWRSLLQSIQGTLGRANRSEAPAPVYRPEQDSIQYIPLPAPARVRQSRPRPGLAPLRAGGAALATACLILVALILFRSFPSPSSVASRGPSACPANLVSGTSAGCAFFKSSINLKPSGQDTNTAINDILEIDLANVPAPAKGMSYYAWLLGSSTNPESVTVFLHQLTVDHGSIHYVYREPQQNDLLAATAAFLITEEDANFQPIAPSPDHSTWRYYSALPQTPDPQDTTNHYSVLDHLHHLLTADPQLEGLNLQGGLGIWLQRNSLASKDLALAAQEAAKQHKGQQARNQLIGMLDYLDGSVYVTRDVPAGTGLQVNPTLVRVAILTFDPLNQEPEAYLAHIAYHLNAIAASHYATAYQRMLASQLTKELSSFETQFEQVRSSVKSLLQMNNTQLETARAAGMLSALVAQTGQIYQGPASGAPGGIAQFYQSLQNLAAFSVQPYK